MAHKSRHPLTPQDMNVEFGAGFPPEVVSSTTLSKSIGSLAPNSHTGQAAALQQPGILPLIGTASPSTSVAAPQPASLSPALRPTPSHEIGNEADHFKDASMNLPPILASPTNVD